MHHMHPSHLFSHQKTIDMTHGSLAGKILQFALPLAATSVLQQLFNAADLAVVGQFVGEAAMAAVGSNSYLINLVVNLFVGISLGTNVVISQYIGADNPEGVKKAVHTSIVAALAGGVVFSLIGELVAVRALGLLSVPPDVIGLATIYLRVYFLGLPVIFLYNFEAAIFRSYGDTQTPLLVLMLAGVINVLLNLFLVCMVHLTVEGVAIATVTSNAISTGILFVLLLRHEGVIRVIPSQLRPDGRVLRRILTIGVPSGIQSAVFSLSNICLQSAINSLGTTVMAGSAAAANLEILAYFVLNSFGQACTTFVGQNYGAGQPERCRRTFRICLLMDAAFTAVTCGLILYYVRPLIGLFNPNPDILSVGVIRLRYIFFAYIFSVQVEIYSGYLRGFGRSLLPALAALGCVCGIRILWVFTVFPHFRTYATIVTAYPISLAANAMVLLILCLRMNRKLRTKEII